MQEAGDLFLRALRHVEPHPVARHAQAPAGPQEGKVPQVVKPCVAGNSSSGAFRECCSHTCMYASFAQKQPSIAELMELWGAHTNAHVLEEGRLREQLASHCRSTAVPQVAGEHTPRLQLTPPLLGCKSICFVQH